MYTEFISSEGLIRNASKSVQKLDIYPQERPIGIQFFGGNTDSMIAAVEIVSAAHPDLIDINYGCPVHKVVCKGGGAAILQDIPKMIRMTSEVVRHTHLPVTVKTRLGWDESTINIEEVAERLQDIGILALTIHARTRKQLYKGLADWTYISKVKNNPRIHIPIFGNGDVDSPEKALEIRNTYNIDGIMIGRGAIGNPWIFRDIKHYFKYKTHLPPPTISERISVCKQHLDHALQWKGEKLGILEMRRHYTNYFRNLTNIKPFRYQLVTVDNYDEICFVFKEMVKCYEGF